MFTNTIIKENAYYDSVTLMSLGSKIKSMDGVKEAVVVMATEMNKEILNNVGLANEKTEHASVNDLVIALKCENEEVYNIAYQAIDDKLSKGSEHGTNATQVEYKTIQHAVKENPDANVAIISVPGKYAAREARLALNNNMHVMMFSDNVKIEDELELKQLAVSKGLLMMGPDCGTAIINNVGLCFANKVKKGNIGIVGASGTGLQEVLVQIDRLGGGITQAIGTGGRDLSEAIGGLMMLAGIEALNADEDTSVIVLVSKPPAKSVERKIMDLAFTIKKPVVVCFLEAEINSVAHSNIHMCNNLCAAAIKAVELSGITMESSLLDSHKNALEQKVINARRILNSEQSYMRGLYCGGTLCAEAVYILRQRLGSIKSNISHKEGEEISGRDKCIGNVLLDLGDDEFTNGRPHPMIEPSLRNEKIIEQASDPSVGVILLDFEIGYGSNENPAQQTIESIRRAKYVASLNGREIVFVGYVCGTSSDRQNMNQQIEILSGEGVIIATSNVEAANIVADILRL